MSIASCVSFIVDTYTKEMEVWMLYAEIVFSTFFAFQYLVGLYAAERKLNYMLSLQPIVDVVTVIPFFLLLYYGGAETQGIGFLRVSRIMKFARVLRLLRIVRSARLFTTAANDAIQNQLASFVSVVLVLIVCTTGLVHYLASEVELASEGQWMNNEEPIHFHDALYYTIVTFALVGYGDISPQGTIGDSWF